MTIRPVMTCAFLLAAVQYASMSTAIGQGGKPSQSDASVTAFESPHYGVRMNLPAAWPVFAREKDELVFVSRIARPDQPDRPGVMACEIAIAPESLEEYRTRIEKNAERGNTRGVLLVNVIRPAEPDGLPQRLETVREFRLDDGETWQELSFLIIRGRHLYTFVLNVEADMLGKVRPAFEKSVASVEYTTPDSGSSRVAGAPANRWVQSEYQFVVDLPEGWSALLAPREVAILYANGPPKGIWADNMLVLAAKRGSSDYESLAKSLPGDLEAVDPTCSVRFSRVIRTREGQPALETVVDVKRGPFAMTIHEWRFRFQRYDYELKFTVESARYDDLKPQMIRCFESFAELPGDEADTVDPTDKP